MLLNVGCTKSRRKEISDISFRRDFVCGEHTISRRKFSVSGFTRGEKKIRPENSKSRRKMFLCILNGTEKIPPENIPCRLGLSQFELSN